LREDGIISDWKGKKGEKGKVKEKGKLNQNFSEEFLFKQIFSIFVLKKIPSQPPALFFNTEVKSPSSEVDL